MAFIWLLDFTEGILFSQHKIHFCVMSSSSSCLIVVLKMFVLNHSFPPHSPFIPFLLYTFLNIKSYRFLLWSRSNIFNSLFNYTRRLFYLTISLSHCSYSSFFLFFASQIVKSTHTHILPNCIIAQENNLKIFLKNITYTIIVN